MASPKVRVAVLGSVGKAVFVNPNATEGSTFGTDFKLADGSIATVKSLRELLGLGGSTTKHSSLSGLQEGDDHPQYTMWYARETIKGQWDFVTAVWGADGTAAAPEFTFTGDVDTGMYRLGANHLGFSTAGVSHWDINTARVAQDIPLVVTNNSGIRVDNESEAGAGLELTTFGVAEPDGVGSQIAFWERADKRYGFRIRQAGDADITGDLVFYRHNDDLVGAAFMRMARSSDQLQFADGSAGAPVVAFIGDLDTGLYRAAADQIGVSTGGSNRLIISTSSFAATLPWLGPSGSASSPTFSFSGDANTGMYRIGSDSVGIAAGGVERFGVGSVGEIRVSSDAGTAGQVLTSGGTGVAASWEDAAEGGGSLVYANIDVPFGNTVTGTSSETDFDTTHVVAVADLEANTLLRVKAFGHFSTDANSSPTLRLRVKLNSTTVLDSGVVAVDDTLTDAGWNAEVHILVITDGASGEVEAQGYFMIDGQVFTVANTATISVDLSADQTIALSAEFNQADDDAITLHQLMIERHTYVGTPTPSSGFRGGITVPDASIASSLTDFPVYVDLSDMPSDFWTHLAHDDGGDIRVRTSGGSDIPFDLLWVDRANERGALFYKQTLTNGGNTVAYIHYGVVADELVPVTDPNGRNAVWADYERVFTFGDNQTDRTGNGSDARPVNTNTPPKTLENTTTSADLGAHQGVAWDGTHYYVVDTNSIKKYDASFSLVDTNSDPCGDVTTMSGDTVDHCGDPCIHNGFLYVPIEIYVNISTWSNMKVARFDPATLDLVDVFDVSAQAHEVASICFCPEDGLMYIASFADNTKLFRYDPDTLAFDSNLSLSGESHGQFQGVTWWRGAFWLSVSTPVGAVVRCEFSGVERSASYYLTTGVIEGLDAFGDEGLVLLHDTTGSSNGVVRRLIPYRGFAGGGVSMAAASSEQYVATGVTEFTNWTMSASVRVASTGLNRAILSYDVNAAAVATNRATFAYRNALGQFGLWNDTDSWLMTGVSASTATNYRLHATQNGTTDRKLYFNGGNVVTDSGVAQKPGGAASALYIGVENALTLEDFDGLIGFVYLRDGVLSADWIAAEYSNLNAPASFYTVGSEEPV